eukprot:4479684-Amphidinium_carterae.2
MAQPGYNALAVAIKALQESCELLACQVLACLKHVAHLGSLKPLLTSTCGCNQSYTGSTRG